MKCHDHFSSFEVLLIVTPLLHSCCRDELHNLLSNGYRQQTKTVLIETMMEDDDLDDEELSLKSPLGIWSFYEDIKVSIFDARYTAPIVAVLGIILAYQVTIAPYQTENHITKKTEQADNQPLGLLRPQLSHQEMVYIQNVAMNMETEFSMPLPSMDAVKLRFHSTVSEHGTHNPPELFYEGVTFGLTHENPYNLLYTAQSTAAKKDLLSDLLGMNPRPTHVMNRTASFNSTSNNETGYAVHFSYADLAKQGKLSSDRREPWKRVLEDVLQIARDYKQIYITVWYPHSFGKRALTVKKEKNGLTDKSDADADKKLEIVDSADDTTVGAKVRDAEAPLHRLEVVLQQIIPTRTGMSQMKSTATVWMSALNQTEPHAFKPLGIHRA